MSTRAWSRALGLVVVVGLALGHASFAAATPRVACWTKASAASGRLAAKRRPHRCGLVTRRSARPALRLIRLHWKRWAARRASATGRSAGTTYRLTLRRPVHGCRGRVFSRAVLHSGHGSSRLALATRCVLPGGGTGAPGSGGQPGGGTPPGGGAPSGGAPPVAGGACVSGGDDLLAGDDPPPPLNPALFGVAFALDTSLDGLADDGTLPLDIGAVCGLPADLAADGAQLVGLSGVALLTATTQIWTCGGGSDEQRPAGDGTGGCTDDPTPGGTLLQGADATTQLDGADSAFVGGQLLPQADWQQDEDGAPLPTFAASWIKITD